MASLDSLCIDPGHAFICYVKMLRETFLKKSTKDSCFHIFQLFHIYLTNYLAKI